MQTLPERQEKQQMAKIWINLLLLLGGLFVGLLISEASVRLVASFNPKVAFLSTIGKESAPYYADTLEEYVKTPGFLLSPHSRYNGCKTNSFGFNDEEFNDENTETIAIGDSFLFGRVPYPENIVTQLEDNLFKRCGSIKKFPIANFGIAGLQPRDYLEVTRLALKKYKPKTILLHLYLGNDFPEVADLDHLVGELPKSESFIYRYFTSRFVLFRLYSNLKRILTTTVSLPATKEESPADSNDAAGTCKPLSESEKRDLSRPAFQSADWLKVVRTEAERFYPPPEPQPSRLKNQKKRA